MDFFKRTLGTFIALGLYLLFFAFRQMADEAFQDTAFSFIPAGLRPMIEPLLMYLGFGIVCFSLGKDFHKYSRPIEKFKIFIHLKIKQGKKILNSSMEDKKTRRLSNGNMDYTQIKDFNDCYQAWKNSVHKGFEHATKFKKTRIFNMPLIDDSTFYGGARKHLKKEIEVLEEFEKNPLLKSDILVKSFNPDILEEYKDFKCP